MVVLIGGLVRYGMCCCHQEGFQSMPKGGYWAMHFWSVEITPICAGQESVSMLRYRMSNGCHPTLAGR